MAKQFSGFTTQQQQKLLSPLGYNGPAQQDDINKFMMSSPKAASMMGKYTQTAIARVSGGPNSLTAHQGTIVYNNGETPLNMQAPMQMQQPMQIPQPTQMQQPMQYRQAMNEGGMSTGLDSYQQNLADQNLQLTNLTNELSNMPVREDLEEGEVDQGRKDLEDRIAEQQTKVTQAEADLASATKQFELTDIPSTSEILSTSTTDPESMVKKQDVVTTTDEQKEAGKIDTGTGQAGDTATGAASNTAAIAKDVDLAAEFEAAGMTAEQASEEVANVLSTLEAATGKPSGEALAEAASMDPSELAQLGLTVEQIDRARRVEEIPDLAVTPEMKVSSAVDYERAKEEINFSAATGVPSTEATVQGQLTSLMADFEGSDPPAWAAGALRGATAAMAARGLGASSMAGQAIVQAAMESALPIAMQDASTRAQFEAQNISNRQQAALFAAEQRAVFLGMEFDQEFKARVQNAARVADIANINFTADQQVALENARLAQTVDIANLDAANAKILADAAAMSQLDMANLNNRQQAAIQNANAFLQMDMSNLDREQQTAIMKAQTLTNALLTDAAAVNAERQFNASSQNQVDMFFANLQTDIQKFNNEQFNAQSRFNAGEANAIGQFNASQQNARDQFNANNAIIIEQANAMWEQKITTTDNAAQNAANRDATMVANGYTETAYNNILQKERDIMDYVWRSADNELARENAYTIAAMQTQAQVDQASGSAVGKLFNTVVETYMKYKFPS